MRIRRIILKNFKKYKDEEIEFSDKFNVFIGDNESGKSTILEAIDLTLSCSRNRVDTKGIYSLFNLETINDFLSGEKKINDLPTLSVELFIDGIEDRKYHGNSNSLKTMDYGISLIIKPDDEFIIDIKDSLENTSDHFPFEFYEIIFKTFSQHPLNGYNKIIKHIYIETSDVGSERSSYEFTRNMYRNLSSPVTRQQHLNKFNVMKSQYVDEVLKDFNEEMYNDFRLNKANNYNLEKNLMLYEDDISLTNRGKGKQVLIKTKLAIEKKEGTDLHIILLEEPENHLSYNEMLKLIEEIKSDVGSQLFITTHNDLILSRLDLNHAIFLKGDTHLKFQDLDRDTSKYFNKLPNSNLLQFMLSKKVVLVEGPTEYILFEKFYELIHGNKPIIDGVSIISVNSLSFKRYLEVNKKFNNKVAVVTDNDSDYNENITLKYEGYILNNIKIFTDENNDNNTFEVSLYNENQELLENLNLSQTSNLLSFMLKNKTEYALRLLTKLEEDSDDETEIIIPQYIKDALTWIKE